MIKLPTGAFTVIQDEAVVVERKATSIILSMEDLDVKPKKPNSGTIAYTSEELNKYQGCKVVFRDNFGEDIVIKGTEMIYFRDFESSIFYVIEDKK